MQSKTKRIALLIGASALSLALFQNFTKENSALDGCARDPLCSSIFEAMKSGHGLNGSNLNDEQFARLANEVIEHAINRTGFGISYNSSLTPNVSKANALDRMARVAWLIRQGLAQRDGNVYEDNEAGLRQAISGEATRASVYKQLNKDGDVVNETVLTPYKGLTPQHLLSPREIAYNSAVITAHAKLVVARMDQALKAYGKDDYRYDNAVRLKQIYGSAKLGYANLAGTDEQRWSLLRKVIGSQSLGVDGGIDKQINLPEVLDEFWFNHFNIHMDKAANTAGGKDGFDHTLRANFYGNFRDLLFAELTHPAMLVFLDNDDNCVDRQGVPSNQNLGREVLELHTLGQAPGLGGAVYNQADVEVAARVLAGVNVDGTAYRLVERKDNKGRTTNFDVVEDGDGYVGSWFSPACAPRTIAPAGSEMLFANSYFDQNALIDQIKSGKTHKSTPIQNLRSAAVGQMVTMLANHPQTKRNICSKLAAVFGGGTAVVDSLAESCRVAWGKDGDLRKMYTAMLSSPVFWSRENFRSKLKNPVELVVSMARLSGVTAEALNADPKLASYTADAMLAQLERIGLEYKQYVDPTGYQLEGEDWLGSGYMFRQIDAAIQSSTAAERYNASLRAPPARNAIESELKRAPTSAVGDLVFAGIYPFAPRGSGPTSAERGLILAPAEDKRTADLRNGVAVPGRSVLTLMMSNNWFLRK